MKTNLMTAMLASAAMFLGATAQAGNFVAKSPSGKLTLTVNSGSKLTWKVDLNGKEIIKPSELAVTLTDGSVWGPGASGGKAQKISRKITTPHYTKSQIDDVYTKLALKGNQYTVEFRVYDDAVAYRFCGARKDSVNVKDETVEYNFAGDPNTWTPWIAGEEQGERGDGDENDGHAEDKPGRGQEDLLSFADRRYCRFLCYRRKGDAEFPDQGRPFGKDALCREDRFAEAFQR